MLTLEQLSQFLTVVKFMNFTKAAQSMYISHSTVSRNVMKLEEELRVKLFVRTNKNVVLTRAGEVLAAKSEELFQKFRELEEEVRIAGSGVRGKLTVAMGHFYCTELFNALNSYKGQYPDINMEMDFSRLDRMMPDIMYGRVDMGVYCLLAEDILPEDFQTITLARGKFCAVVSKRHPLAKKTVISAQDISADDLRPLYGLAYHNAERIFGDGGKVYDASQSTREENLASIMLKVKAGDGVAFLPAHMATEFGEGYSVLDIEGEGDALFYSVSVFWNRHSTNPALPLFLETISEYVDSGAEIFTAGNICLE